MPESEPVNAAWVGRANATLHGARPEVVLRWANDTFGSRLAVSVSFGGLGGLALVHMLSEINRSIPILFIDTGFLFPETLAFKDQIVAQYGLNVRTLAPIQDVGPLYTKDLDACCAARRVEPLDQVLEEYDAWVSAIRRDQSATREAAAAVELHQHRGRPLLKVHPLAFWQRADVSAYLQAHHVPLHPLLERGYTSLGCWPCTTCNTVPEDERAGRWAGHGKTECGLHTFTNHVSSI